MRNGLSESMGFTAPISGPSFTATWTAGFFITALPGSDVENAVMNIFWPSLVSAGTSAFLSSETGPGVWRMGLWGGLEELVDLFWPGWPIIRSLHSCY